MLCTLGMGRIQTLMPLTAARKEHMRNLLTIMQRLFAFHSRAAGYYITSAD